MLRLALAPHGVAGPDGPDLGRKKIKEIAFLALTPPKKNLAGAGGL